MAKLLQRLGLAVARRRGMVIIGWLLVLVGVGVGAATLSGPTANSFSIPGAESSAALAVVKQEFPGLSADGATAQVVVQAPPGSAVTDPQNAAKLKAFVDAAGRVPDVQDVRDPLDKAQPVVSQDRQVAVATVTFAGTQGNVSDESLGQVEQAAETMRAAGFGVKIGGDAFQQVPEAFGPAEIGGVLVAFLVLMLTYGALGAAGANLGTALIGVGIGAAGITALTGFVDLQSTTPILAIMLGLAVGIDYALFIFARFRSELRDGRSVDEAVGRATGTAGSAVVVAGLTVVIALAGLSVVGIPFLAQMGLAAAATVIVSVLVALTLVPALLSLIGVRILRKRFRDIPTADAHDENDDAPGFQGRWAKTLTRRPVVAALGGIALLGVLAAPVFAVHTALPDSGSADPASQQRQAFDVIAQKFGPGLNAPLLMLVEGDQAAQLSQTVAAEVKSTPGVVAVTAPAPSADGKAALFTVIPVGGATDDSTARLVNTLRDKDFGPGLTLAVTGVTAIGIDVDKTLADALPIYLIIVVGLALLLLLLVFRSIMVPITATAGFLLSYGAALGVTTAVFQWGWLSSVFGVTQPAPLMSLLPIIVVAILFGLAMDYQVFLVSRIHEAYSHGEEPRAAIRHGFRRSAPVVIAAAVIMAAVFGGFIGNHDPMIKSIALALTVGVMFDAFVVRMVIIPAVLALLGSGAWWLPKWLDRLMPHVDVEGKAIEAMPLAPAKAELASANR